MTWLTDCVKEGIKFVLTGDLRKIAGLGVNITEVYPTGRCYLKGFFNALEAWRGDRDLEGWRLTDYMFEVGSLEAGDSPDGEWRAGYLLNTRITDELIAHAKALLALFISETPLMVPLRPTDSHKLRYCIDDASA